MIEHLVSDFVKEAPPYVVGVSETGIVNNPNIKEVIRLATNENPYGVAPAAVEAMVKAAFSTNRYPDVRGMARRQKLADLKALKLENVKVCEGATVGLGQIGEVFLRQGDEVILSTPTSPAYLNIVKKNRAVLVDVPYDENMELDLNAVYQAITPKTKLIFFCNPNNPTGTLLDDEKLYQFIKKVPPHVVVVVDEAYIHFVEEPNYKSMICAIDDKTNLIVVQTFSKIYGLAGARVGYMMSNAEIIHYLLQNSTGFCGNKFGLAGAEAALDDTEFPAKVRKNNSHCRKYLTDELTALGFRVFPSAANFIYFDSHVNPAWLADELMKRGVLIRGNFKYNRISIGTMHENEVAVHYIKEILGK